MILLLKKMNETLESFFICLAIFLITAILLIVWFEYHYIIIENNYSSMIYSPSILSIDFR